MSKRLLAAIAIIEFLAILGILGYFLYKQNESNQTVGFTENKAGFGTCIKSLPNPVVDSNFLKLEVTVKGKDLYLSNFKWDDTDYTSKPGCFTANADRSIKTLSNYIHWNRIDSVFPFSTVIRTQAVDNDMEFSLKVSDLNNKVIGKFPDNGDPYKTKIPVLQYPAMISNSVKLKK